MSGDRDGDLCSSGGPRKTPILASARGSKLVPTFRGDPASQSSNQKGLWWGTGLGGRGRGDEQRSEAVPSLSDMGSRAGSRPQLSNERVASQVTTTRHWGWEGTVNESGMLRDLHRLRSCGRGPCPHAPVGAHWVRLSVQRGECPPRGREGKRTQVGLQAVSGGIHSNLISQRRTLSRLGAELELRRSGSSLGPSQ